MRLTIKRDGKRVPISQEIARLQTDNKRLLRRALAAEADAALARSSSNEWRDRYHSLRQRVGVGEGV